MLVFCLTKGIGDTNLNFIIKCSYTRIRYLYFRDKRKLNPKNLKYDLIE